MTSIARKDAVAARRRVAELRRRIDLLDAGLVRLLDRRVAAAREIAVQKARAGLPPRSPPREAEVLRRAAQQAAEHLDVGARRRVLRAVIEETVRIANGSARRGRRAASE